jgi:hypothetical protein
MSGGQNEFPNDNLLGVISYVVLFIKFLEIGRNRQLYVLRPRPVIIYLDPNSVKNPVHD